MTYFISDIHLGLGNKADRTTRENLLLAFLQRIGSECEILYIVGDLFDYWFEYKTVLPREFFRTLTALDELRKKGVRIEYLIGNHDFGHQDFFATELDIPVFKDDLIREHQGKKFYLAHGDGKVYNDRGYLILRSILRNKFNIRLYQWLHPDFGIKLASNTSSKSRTYTDAKNYGQPDGLSDFAEKKIKEGFDFVIMGHRHTPLIRDFGDDQHRGAYINLGDWLSHFTFARFDGENLQLLNVREFLKNS